VIFILFTKFKNVFLIYTIMETSQIIMLLIGISLIIYYILVLRYTFINKQLGDPWLIETTHSLQNPKTIRSELIRRSNDSKYGVEFTYTFWIYIEKWPTEDTDKTHLLHKGENSETPILQAPGIWLQNNTNTMIINMNSLKNLDNTVNIEYFPIKKWVHVSVMLINSNLDVFINGKLIKRKQLLYTTPDLKTHVSPPKENYGNLYISNSDAGIRGYISRFRYFNSAIPFWRIEQMVKDEPSRAACPITNLTPPKLSADWWG
jgi:hypothetical protein